MYTSSAAQFGRKANVWVCAGRHLKPQRVNRKRRKDASKEKGPVNLMPQRFVAVVPLDVLRPHAAQTWSLQGFDRVEKIMFDSMSIRRRTKISQRAIEEAVFSPRLPARFRYFHTQEDSEVRTRKSIRRVVGL